MQRLLHITFEPKPALKKELEKEFDLYEIWFPELQQKKEDVDVVIQSVVNSFKPDIILKECAGSLSLKEETYKVMVDSGAKLFQWTQDVITPLDKRIEPINEFARFGVSLFSNYMNVEDIKGKGFIGDFFAPSVDFEIYNSKETPIRFRDVSFIVNNYNSTTPLADFRVKTVDYLEKNFGSCFHLFGGHWFKGNDFVGGVNEAKAYSESLMSVNLSQYEGVRYTSDRIFKIIGCKSLCLNYEYPGVQKDFPYVVNWKTLDDLKYIINYYKKNPEGRVELVNKAHEHLMQNHTWGVRVKQLNELIEKYK